MFRKRDEATTPIEAPAQTDRVTSVLGSGLAWKGQMSGRGGVRIEGSYEGEIALRGMLVVGETGRVTCEQLRANVVIVAGAVRGDITAQKLEIRSTGRVWGDVVTAAFSTEEGAFLRGQITMEEKVDIGPTPGPEEDTGPVPSAQPAEADGETVGQESKGEESPEGED